MGYVMIERSAIGEKKPPMKEDEGFHLSTRDSQGDDLNRDEVRIPILVEITHDNGYNGALIIKGVNR
jgi:hypothetical protein